MIRVILALLFLVIALPVQAQNEPLSPSEVETLNFNDSRVNELNTLPLLNEIDMSEEVEHHEKNAGLPQFDVTTFSSQLFWLALSFAVLYVFFAKKALPAISSTIETRNSTIRNDVETADKLSAQIRQLQDEYETAMDNARHDARKATVSVENETRQMAEQQSADFREKTMAAVAAVEHNAELAKNKIRTELEDITAELVSDIVTKLSAINISDAEIKKAVQAELNDKAQQSSSKKAA